MSSFGRHRSKTQQAELINRLGPETNLGNIAPDDVLSLEALRRGLRADTINGLIMESRKMKER